jgi:hypothetical protein
MLQEVFKDDDLLKVFWVNGSTAYAYGATAAPPLLWWQKLELNEYLRNPASK